MVFENLVDLFDRDHRLASLGLPIPNVSTPSNSISLWNEHNSKNIDA